MQYRGIYAANLLTVKSEVGVQPCRIRRMNPYKNTIAQQKSKEGRLHAMLGDNIRLLRSVRGISQVELGEKLNVSKQSISNWENGNIQPSIEMLMKIADFFSVSTDFLLGLDNRTSIIVDGLSTEELSHIRVIIDDLVAAKRRMGIEQNDDRPRE